MLKKLHLFFAALLGVFAQQAAAHTSPMALCKRASDGVVFTEFSNFDNGSSLWTGRVDGQSNRVLLFVSQVADKIVMTDPVPTRQSLKIRELVKTMVQSRNPYPITDIQNVMSALVVKGRADIVSLDADLSRCVKG